MRGWIALNRKLVDSELWLSEPFTRGQAWVDLLMLANHKPGHIRKRGIRVDVNRGEFAWSERELAIRWKWSRGKVRRYLNELCSGSNPKLVPQTSPQKSNVTSKYLIKNYDAYQNIVPQTSPQTGHKRYQNNNDNNENKREAAKKRAATLPPQSIEFSETHHRLAQQSDVSLADEWTRYVDWAHAKGERRVDHLRAFNNWLRRCAEYNRNNGEPTCRLKEADYDD